MPKMISEYGGKEKYPSKAAMKKHEKTESPAMERREKKMAKGGKVSSKEGTAKDMREDKAMAKKRGMTMAQWEKSAADKKHDAPKKMAKGGAVHKMPDGTMMPGKSHGAPKKMAEGGKLKMVEKGGKKVPAFAADGVGKMATGGSVRGTGAAIRGKGFSGTY